MEGGTIGMGNLRMVAFNRKKLYDEIWKLSVAGTARKYDLHYTRLLQSLKDYQIPYPPSSYWTKLSQGMDVSGNIVELPDSDDEEIYLYPKGYTEKRQKKNLESKSMGHKDEQKEKSDTLNINTVAIHKSMEETLVIPDTVLDFLEKDERAKVLYEIETMEIGKNSKLHPVVVAYKKSVQDWKQREKNIKKETYYEYKDRLKEKPAFLNNLSDACLNRVILILDGLFKSIEKLGGKAHSDLSMQVKADVVRITFIESKEKKEHGLTKQEARAVLEYKDKIKYSQYAYKPQIPKYDHFYNGKLRIKFENGKYIKDNEQQKLEDRLGEIVIKLYEISEDYRKKREKREEEWRQYEEEERKRKQQQELLEKEQQATQALMNEAKDYQIALEIRNLIKAAEGKFNMSEKNEWIEWAKKKADWFDPTIAREDEILGKRDHKLPEEEKQLIEKRIQNLYWK